MPSCSPDRRRVLALPFAAACLAAVPALAATPPASAALSPEDQADVKRIEAYLNGITTLSGRFLQTGSDGSEATGRFYVARPGRLRFEYDPPVPVLIIATGDVVIHYDRNLKAASQIFQDSTPAAFLAEKEIRLSGDLTVRRVGRRPGVLDVTFVKTKEPQAGSVTLTLGDNPLALRQWTVIDPQNIETRVSLLDYQAGGRLDPKLFVFDEPTWQDEDRKR